MKRSLFSMLLIFFLGMPFSAYSTSSPGVSDPIDSKALRLEFDSLFAASPIYKAIRKNLPDTYEDCFQAYLDTKKSGRDFQAGTYINSIRNTYLKQSSGESILSFFRYTVDVGKEILAKDPEAAFAYIFGGDPGAYISYIDLGLEQERLGRIYDQMLSTRAVENLDTLDRKAAEEGMDYVNALLYLKHGDDFLLLKKDVGGLSSDERRRVCVIYLDVFNEIFQLAPATRDNVLRSFTARM